MSRAIFFSGPIGSGKTTLGRAVAARMGAAFFDGDDFADHCGPWFASSLRTSRRIAAATLAALATGKPAIVAYPLRVRITSTSVVASLTPVIGRFSSRSGRLPKPFWRQHGAEISMRASAPGSQK